MKPKWSVSVPTRHDFLETMLNSMDLAGYEIFAIIPVSLGVESYATVIGKLKPTIEVRLGA